MPLTGVKWIKKIVANLAVNEVSVHGFVLLKRASGVSVEIIKEATEGTLLAPEFVPEMTF